MKLASLKGGRDGRPVVALSRTDRTSIDALTGWLEGVLASFRSGQHSPVDPGPMAPHSHADGTVHSHA